MKLYLSMVAMGSIGTLAYIIILHLLPCNFDLRWRQRYLRINALCYMIPIPWLISCVKTMIRNVAGAMGYEHRNPTIEEYHIRPNDFWHSMKVVDPKTGFVYYTGYEKLGPYIVIGSIICILSILAIIIIYMRMTISLKRSITHTSIFLWGRQKIKIGESPEIDSPISIGIFRPMILVPPNKSAYATSWDAILQHELTHVYVHDSFFRLLTAVAIAVAWYNPLTYYLMREHISVGEMLCDEKAVMGLSKEQKKDYMNCMLTAMATRRGPDVVVQHLGAKKSLTRKRFENIMEDKKKVWKSTVSCLVAVLCFGISSVPAFAYEKPIININNSNREWTEEDWNKEYDLVLVAEGEEAQCQYAEEVIDFTASDIVIMNAEGELVPYVESDDVQTQAECIHKFESTKLYKHIKNSNGGCTVERWSGKKCSQCGGVQYGEIESATTYKSCPHK